MKTKDDHCLASTFAKMNIQGALKVPYWLPKLEGKSNWADWRRNIEEAIYEVEQTDVYWNIIMDKYPDSPEDIKQEPKTTTDQEHTKNSSSSISSVASGFSGDDDVMITGSSNNNGNIDSGGSGLQSYSRRVLNIRAREILCSSMGLDPRTAIDRVSDAHEAYLKLESLYGGTSAQSVFVAYDKLLKVRYYKENPTRKFVNRFKECLQDVKDQAVEVSPTMALAIFQQAIKSHPKTTSFMANMKVDIYDQELMDKVYSSFLEDQGEPHQQAGVTIMESLCGF